MHAHTLAPLDTAMDVVHDERSEVTAERDAFAALADRIAACPAQSPPTAPRHDTGATVTGVGVSSVGSASDGDPSERLRRAYRETVMSVDHYDAVYGESLFENAATELGADLATALRGGVPFSPAFKSKLHETVMDARAERKWFLERLRTETASLTDARETLGDIVDTIPRNGSTPSQTVDELWRRCDDVGRERQDVLRTQFRSAPDGLYEHLYRDQSWTYPVLNVVAMLVADLDGLRRIDDSREFGR
ncbi:DUF7260 family protein (plasmid) [Haloplanus ruber]|uniref:DUF7260 domain-containing protein n=1 Tax=Haloplanus ruber TaxID=869892 RepID=A0ABD6CVD1_9EURY|nr:hypothetical protein [Haloplanus ruber]